jgi:hypothetical protein
MDPVMAKKSKYTPTEKRKARPLGPDAQLCDRLQAAEILGISYGSVRVLEKKGRLKGRRLHEGKSSRLMFPVVEVLKIAKVDDAIRVLPDLGSVIVVNGKTYREVTDQP